MTVLESEASDVARSLLGWRVRTSFDGHLTEVSLTEVEAYNGANDPASHAYRGRTDRNAVMFGPPWRLYVYRSYGIHWCMNVVLGEEGRAAAVLLRGGVPTVGRDIMVARRSRDDHLTDGPGKLCQALGVTGVDNGVNLLGRGRVRLLKGKPPSAIDATPRIGISKATERKWRFVSTQ